MKFSSASITAAAKRCGTSRLVPLPYRFRTPSVVRIVCDFPALAFSCGSRSIEMEKPKRWLLPPLPLPFQNCGLRNARLLRDLHGPHVLCQVGEDLGVGSLSPGT